MARQLLTWLAEDQHLPPAAFLQCIDQEALTNLEDCIGANLLVVLAMTISAMKHIGGKMLVFGACIPSVGELALKLLGTDREVELLRPAVPPILQENVTPDPVLYVQSALLYTNSEGERRIRVHTWAAMTTPNFNDIIGSIDVQASAVMMSHQALAQSLNTNQTEGRNKLSSFCQQVVQAGNMAPQSDALQFLPLYIMGMLKSAAFRATNDISADLRTFIWMRLETLSVSQSAAFFNPRLMALHNAPEECRMVNEHGQIQLPEMLNLTSESMTQDGVYLLEDGESIYMWLGRAVDSSFLQAVFGVSSIDLVDPVASETIVGTRGDPLSATGLRWWAMVGCGWWVQRLGCWWMG
eukprot:Skav214143  [mRNA]  locus=scaffold1645:177217:194553:- [translate_table: standard]